MSNAPSNSVLAKKLNAFIALSAGELKCLADMQLDTVKVKRGQQLTNEGQTGHRVFVIQAGPAVTSYCQTAGARSSRFPSRGTSWDFAASY
jgi:hypothetical protein